MKQEHVHGMKRFISLPRQCRGNIKINPVLLDHIQVPMVRAGDAILFRTEPLFFGACELIKQQRLWRSTHFFFLTRERPELQHAQTNDFFWSWVVPG